MTSHPNLIAGEWIGGTSSPNVNPSNTAEIVGHYDQADRDQAAAAIAAARQALPGWAMSGIDAECLFVAVGTDVGLLARSAEELARAAECGSSKSATGGSGY